MNTVKLMWEFLLESDYADLLLRICDKIETKYGTLEYGEDRIYDYRELLKEFWCHGPERCKRYVFSNQKMHNGVFEAKECVELLMKLLTLRKFTHEDRQIINLILASADDKEKENINRSENWVCICCDLLKEEKWESLNQFMLNWFSTKEEADTFKRKLSMNYHICIDFVKNNRWDVAEFYIRWIASSEKEINILKKEMIYSTYGKEVCKKLTFSTRSVEAANTFCEWFFPSEGAFGKFKKECFFPDMQANYCPMYLGDDMIEVVDKFTKWCFPSEEEINEIKKEFAYAKGGSVCEELISNHSVLIILSEEEEEEDLTGEYTIKFVGGKWELVEKFLTWCFSTEKEISDFKKIVLTGTQSQRIHFNLIKCNRWQEAERYFAWLGLSSEEIKELKIDTLFSYHEASKMFIEMMYNEKEDTYFEYVDYGGKQEAIELLLRWYLTDKETVLKFKDEFERNCRGREYDTAMFQNFDVMIEQRLNDLDEEQKGVKRNSEFFPQ